MNRLAFATARLMRRDAPWPRCRSRNPRLLADLSGRHVALIGNARALADQAHGARIDAADRVVRINRAPMPSPASHGTRTDWLGLATRLPDADRARLDPGRILWMSPKRKRLDWDSASSPGFYLHPLADIDMLAGRLGAPPTTGAIADRSVPAQRSGIADALWFDFFASLSLSGRRNAAQVPHDFAPRAPGSPICCARTTV